MSNWQVESDCVFTKYFIEYIFKNSNNDLKYYDDNEFIITPIIEWSNINNSLLFKNDYKFLIGKNKENNNEVYLQKLTEDCLSLFEVTDYDCCWSIDIYIKDITNYHYKTLLLSLKYINNKDELNVLINYVISNLDIEACPIQIQLNNISSTVDNLNKSIDDLSKKLDRIIDTNNLLMNKPQPRTNSDNFDDKYNW